MKIIGTALADRLRGTTLADEIWIWRGRRHQTPAMATTMSKRATGDDQVYGEGATNICVAALATICSTAGPVRPLHGGLADTTD